jgi:hypothetical protein
VAGNLYTGRDFDKAVKKLFDNCNHNKGNNYWEVLETKKLTDDAERACGVVGINPIDLYEK